LPVRAASCGAVLFVVALSFVADPMAALREARRVLAPRGAVIIGEVPASSPMGKRYRAMGAAGHPFYHQARFFTPEALAGLLAASGLQTDRIRSSRLDRDGGADTPGSTFEGLDHQANFVAVSARPW
ncbi:MAG: methyltransferase domain-containing protein, partial [Chloroflexota bacterium]